MVHHPSKEASPGLVMSNRFLLAWFASLGVLCAACGTGQTQTDCYWHGGAGRTLIADVITAEDIAIRHADARGLTPGWRAVREQCEATLFAGVADQHHVTENEIADVRSRLGKRTFDAAVHPPMLLLTVALTTFMTARLKRRFDADLLPYIVASVFWAVFIAALIVVIGHVWSAVLEVYRIGNGHLSYRATRIPWSHQWTQVFLGALTIFAFAALVQARMRAASPPPASPADDLISLK